MDSIRSSSLSSLPVDDDAHKSFRIGGCHVRFPYVPYPAQFALMSKVIKSLTLRENALLESPTGTGKTLALLCSSLAWHAQAKLFAAERLYLRSRLAQLRLRDESHSDSVSDSDSDSDSDSTVDEEVEEATRQERGEMEGESEMSKERSLALNSLAPFNGVVYMKNSSSDETDDDDDFVDPLPRPESTENETPAAVSGRSMNESSGGVERRSYRTKKDHGRKDRVEVEQRNEEMSHEGTRVISSIEEELRSQHLTVPIPDVLVDALPDRVRSDFLSFRTSMDPECDSFVPTTGKNSVPKIFYATRTHSQVAQAIRELEKTTYRPKMTVLGSRDHMCIHPSVSRSLSKNDECKKTIENGQCRYFSNSNRLSSSREVFPGGDYEVFDIEDIVAFGKRLGGCPYFATRELLTTAELVFCPYNYLIDPVIRKSMDIDLNHAIVILDEAHNVEDCCRDASSFSIAIDLFTVAWKEFDRISEEFRTSVVIQEYMGALERLSFFLRSFEERMRNMFPLHSGESSSFQTSSFRRQDHDVRVLGDGFDQSLVYSGIRLVQFFSELGIDSHSYPSLRKDFDSLQSLLSLVSQRKYSELFGLRIESAPLQAVSQFFVVLDYFFDGNLKNAKDYRLVLQRKPEKNSFSKKASWSMLVCLWCLNPAVSFGELSSIAHSVVLTSGTLSPMDSFETELGCVFSQKLEAPHVIDVQSQLLTRIIGSSLTGVKYRGTYRDSEQYSYQDAVGSAVLEISSRVPGGVLVFFASYSMLHKHRIRWESTGLLADLSSLKYVVFESNTPEDFDMSLLRFDEGISNGTGSIMFAVCRGKVSEGIDFADDRARAIILVGIPYANTKDTQVFLKREYNDSECKNRSLLSGSEWYAQQAFRALNQALGRCLRHAEDFGCIILLDERFEYGENFKMISRWIRASLSSCPSCVPFSSATLSIETFFDSHRQNNVMIDSVIDILSSTSSTLDMDSNQKSDSVSMLTPQSNEEAASCDVVPPTKRRNFAGLSTVPFPSIRSQDESSTSVRIHRRTRIVKNLSR